MKENHLLATSSGMFLTVLIAKGKRYLKQILHEERKNLPSKNLKKGMRQEIQKLTSLGNHLENLIIPQGNYGKAGSLKILKANSLVFYLIIKSSVLM